MDDRTPSTPPALVKEVEPPIYQHSGLGVLLVASLAMTFAVASAAFLVQARMPGDGCPYGETKREVRAGFEPTTPQPETRQVGADCGEASYHANPDGSVTVIFDLCERGDAPAELDGIEIGAIHR